MNFRSTFRSAAAALAMLSAAIFAPSSPAAAATKVIVGVIPITDVAPIYLGKEKGFFEKHGIDLTLQLAHGGAAIVPSVLSGQFQFGFSNVISLMIARSRGLDLKIVAAGNSSTGAHGKDFGGIVAPKGSPLTNAKELEGKRVAVNGLQNIGGVVVKAAVRAAGGDPSKVKFVEIAFPNMPAALAKHQVDAAWIVEPFLTITRQQGAKVISWCMVDTAPHMMISGYFTTAQYIKDHPDVVKNFVAAMDESLQYANTHRDDVRKIVTTYTRIPKKLIPKLTLPDWPTQINRTSTEALAKDALQDGLVSKMPDIDALLPPQPK